MPASKSNSRQSPLVRILRLLVRPRYRGLVLTAAVIVGAIAAALWGWQRWGAAAMRSAEYVLTPEQISVTPQPAWIRTDVKAEVIRNAGIAQLNLREPKLVEQLARAFALHPWVASVVRVEKRYPAEVRVELAYRRPVAVVPVVLQGQSRLLFIDDQSVLLPTSDFDADQAQDYLRIANTSEMPAGVYGTPWGSERIRGAARVAAVLADCWQPLGLYQIDSVKVPGGRVVYEVRTQRGARVLWGVVPGNEPRGEPSADQKVAVLVRHLKEKGSLVQAAESTTIDLREIANPPKTASQPSGARR
jgi:hypothetical protein